MPRTRSKTLSFAPGARVVARDEEWMVRTVKPAMVGGQAVHLVGLSELVQERETIFLTELDEITELKPEETKLVHDDSPQYRRTRLYLDALLRRSPATDDALWTGHRAAIRPTHYQCQPAAKALRQVRPRILMADGVGLGKTIEVGILLSELIQRGRAGRILVVALKSILSQFQKELWARFTIPLVRLDSVGIQRVQTKIPSNTNPFYYFDRVIISIDTLKRDERYRRYLEQSHWDVVVVDECQHVAIRGSGSQRARLARLLGGTSEALILTSATPHDGRPESFASLMNLLDPTAIANPENYTSEEVRDLFIRRFKKDIAHEVPEEFPERELTLRKEAASPEEDAAFEYLTHLEFKTIARTRGGKGVLFRTLLLKSLLSSPAACVSTINNRLSHKDLQVGGDSGDESVRHDREILTELRRLVERVGPAQFRKLQALLVMLRDAGFDRSDNQERVVIFSERIDTLVFLDKTLRKELSLKSDQIELFQGTLDDQDQQRLVESFGTASSPLRILLASDAASEGINLHYHCHRMVHFDLPWSLITLEQRNGRIDRFGQKQTPEISYLLTIPNDPKLKGDLRVLDRLIEKEDAAHKNLGDVAWLMNLHDATKEQERIESAVETGESPELVIPDTEQHDSLWDVLFGKGGATERSADMREPMRLLADEEAYARAAFQEVLGDDADRLEWHDHLDGFTLRPPDDLLRRFEFLPPELRGERNELKLTMDRQRVMDALEVARQDERKWPEWQLFWEQHPVAEWLDDRVLGKFARHEAPVLRVSEGVGTGERIVVFQGVVSNYRSQPVVVDWFGVRFRGAEAVGTTPLQEVLVGTRLDRALANPGGHLPDELAQELRGLLAPGVESAREHMRDLRLERMSRIQEPLMEGIRTLKRWRDQRLVHLGEQREALIAKRGTLRKDQERRLRDETADVDRRYQRRCDWINEGMQTTPEPYLRVAAVLIPYEVH